MGNSALIDLGIDGYLLREDALKLYEMAFCSDGDILELGTHRGLSTSILAQALSDAESSATLETVDIDGVTQTDARETLSIRAGFNRTKFTVRDATQRVLELTNEDRQFGFVFVDHWHGYDATFEVATQLKHLLKPGGFVLFHDCVNGSNADPEHVYGVYQAVLDALAADEHFIFFGNYGCCSLWCRLAATMKKSTIPSQLGRQRQRLGHNWRP
jgi:predicted O-methyltransferase YrrM